MNWANVLKDDAAAMKRELDNYKRMKDELVGLIKKLKDSNMELGFQIDEIVKPLNESLGIMEDTIYEYENPTTFDNPYPPISNDRR